MGSFSRTQKILFIIVTVGLIGVGLVLLVGTTPEANAPSATNEIESQNAQSPAYNVLATTVPYYEDVNGYLAVPEGEGPFPALVLIHEWWGLNDNIRGLAEEFAAEGYVALAVDLYGGVSADTPEAAGALAGAVREDIDGAFANLRSAVTYLESLPEVDSERLASVGWCFGGQWSYEMARNDLGVDASVMYYGRFSPADDFSMMRANILGHFGEEDRSIAVDDVREFEAKLKTLEGDHAIFIYPNAGHAFANEDNEDAYNEEAAQLAWSRTMDFLTRELTAATPRE